MISCGGATILPELLSVPLDGKDGSNYGGSPTSGHSRSKKGPFNSLLTCSSLSMPRMVGFHPDKTGNLIVANQVDLGSASLAIGSEEENLVLLPLSL